MHDIVTSLREKRGGYHLEVNETESVTLSYADFRALPLREGESLNWADYRERLHKQQYPAALNHAVGYLAVRARSRKEVQRKLKERGYLPETIAAVMDKLQKEALLDDDAFARAWVQARTAKQLGKARILQELRIKGVPEEIAQNAIAELDQEAFVSPAAALAQKLLKRYRNEAPKDAIRKSMAAMQRRGYGYGEASRALQAAITEEEDDE